MSRVISERMRHEVVRPMNRPVVDAILYACLLENSDVVKGAGKVLRLVPEKLHHACILGTALLGDRRMKMQSFAVILVPLHPRQRLQLPDECTKGLSCFCRQLHI